MATKKERQEAAERIRETLTRGGPATFAIDWIGGRPSSAGRSDYFEIHVWRVGDDGHPERHEWLTRLFCMATGYGFDRTREAIRMGGCGYSKAHEIACSLSTIFGDVPIHVNARDCHRVFRNGKEAT